MPPKGYVRKPKNPNPTPEQVATAIRNQTRKLPQGRKRSEEEMEVDYSHLEDHRQDMITASKDLKKTKAKARKSAKILDSNTQQAQHTKVQYDFDDCFKVLTFRNESISIPALADRMVAYARREIDLEKRDAGGFSVEDFVYQEGWSLDSFNSLVARHPRLQEAKNYMMLAFGERRDKGATMRALDGGWVARTIGFYSPRHVKEQARLASLQALADAKESINLTVTHHSKKDKETA